MCRNIKTLYNFDPPRHRGRNTRRRATVRSQAERLQQTFPSHEAAFNDAIRSVSETADRLLKSLVTNATPKNREVQAAKARARAALRFGT